MEIKNNIKLYIDLIPKTAWFSNLRSELTAKEWQLVQQKTFSKANYKCECCGGVGSKHPVECHERFSYDSITNTQTLTGTLALCPKCHKTTHFGMAQILGLENMAISNLKRLNKWNQEQVATHIKDAFSLWNQRNLINWKLDASWLLEFIEVSERTKTKINNLKLGITQK